MKYTPTFILGIALSVFLAAPFLGCSKESSKKDAGQVDTLMPEPDQERAREQARQAREEFQRTMERSMETLDRSISELETKLQAKTDETYKQRLEELRRARAELNERYQRAMQASEEAWEDARRTTESSFESVERQYNRLLEQLKTETEAPPEAPATGDGSTKP